MTRALQAAGLLTYDELILMDEEPQQSMPLKQKLPGHARSLNKLEIYPNPTQDYFIADYKLDPRASNSLIYIVGMDGETYYSLKLDKVADQKVIITKTLESGSYLVVLSTDGKKIEGKKLIIAR